MKLINYETLKEDFILLLQGIDLEERKKFLKSMKNDLKRARKGENRKYNLHDLLNVDETYLFLRLDSLNFQNRQTLEKEQSNTFLFNEDEAKKAGWYSKKNDPIQLLKWCEQAYVNIDEKLWTAELEKELVLSSIS